MAEQVNGLYALLKSPAVYEFVQQAMGGDGGRRAFATRDVRARPGDRVLDIGCGPAQILAHLPEVDYVGWEPNPRYVEQARKAFASRGTFNVGYFGSREAEGLDPVDIALVSAVLHHMDDAEARQLFAILRRVVKPGGRVVTLDNVYAGGQNPIARLLISLDRGRNVRTAEGYARLARDSFACVEGRVFHKRFPPYSYFVMTAS